MTPDQIRQLLSPAAYPHPVEDIQLIETHISWVILTGDYAYKIKKPMDLGFLDFAELDKRKYYCHEELRLNSRTADAIYINVLPIVLQGEQAMIVEPPIDERNICVIDYAVQMRQFDNEGLLATLVEEKSLPLETWTELAREVASFHSKAEVFTDEEFGKPALVKAAIEQNFEQIRHYLTDADDIHWLGHIEDWSQEYSRCLQSLIASRKRNGFVRDCHGDLHLGNLVRINEKIILFDCIEFNKNYRIIDTASEIAFTIMDLELRGLHSEANRFLNTYIELSGDYQSVALLTYYKVYRAMVRAKVSLLALPVAERDRLAGTAAYKNFQRYLQLAVAYMKDSPACIVIMHGVSGSGKSYQAQLLAEAMGAIRIRSDVERKRLFGLAIDAKTDSNQDKGIYTADASEKTFQRLADIAEQVVDAGLPCIIDATFLHQPRREQFLKLAQRCEVPFLILDCQPPQELIEQRLKNRQQQGNDPSEADEQVMRQQLKHQQALTVEEKYYTFTTDTLGPIDAEAITKQLAKDDIAYSSYNDCGSQT